MARDEQAHRDLERARRTLQGLSQAAVAVTRAPSLRDTLQIVSDQARRIIGAHLCVSSVTRGSDWSQVDTAVSLTEKYAGRRDYAAPTNGSGLCAWLRRHNGVVRMNQAELEAHPRWQGFGDRPPMRGWLAAAFVGSDGRSLGLIQISDKEDGAEFDADDEAAIVQLANFASAAIEKAQAEAERGSLIDAERRSAEAKRRSEERFRAAIQAVSGVLWTNNARGEMRGKQPGWSALTGQTEAEYQGYGWAQAVHPDDAQATIDAWNLAVAERRIFVHEHRVRRRDGEWRHFAIRAVPLLEEDGGIREWVGVHTDITDAKAAGDTLRTHSLLLEHMHEGVSLSDEAGHIVYTNPALDRLFGYAPGGLVGRHVSVLNAYPAAENERLVAAVIAELRTRGFWEGEWRNRRQDGREFTTASRISAVTIGGRAHWLCVQRDVTRERETAAALKRAADEAVASAAERAAILGQLAEGVIVADAEGRIVYLNEAAARLHGTAALGVLPENYSRTFRLHTMDGRPYPVEELPLARAVLTGEEVNDVRWRIRREGDGEVLAIGSARPLVGPDGVRIGGVLTLRDDTAREAAERQLVESEWRFRTLVELLPMVVWFGEADGAITYSNPYWYDYTGATPEQTRGNAWADYIQPDHRQQAMEVWRIAARDAGPYRQEFPLRGKDGGHRWHLSMGTPIRDEAGRVHRWIGIALDIHERKVAEERQRLLMAEVDHRAKNMLAVLLSMVRLTRKPDVDTFKAAIEGRVGALARAHTQLSRAQWTGASLRELIEEELRPFVADAALAAMLSGPRVTIKPEAAQSFALLVHELAVNATKYGSLSVPDGRLEVTWRRVAGGGLRLEWRERGGPPARAPARKGFGAAVIEASVRQQLGGTFQEDWSPDGLGVLITVPADQLAALGQAGTAGETRGAPGPQPVALDGLRILVAEDNALIAMEVVEQLREAGAVVIGPANSADRARLLSETERPDLAILDVTLADGDTFDLADLLKARNVPFLFATGYGREAGMAPRHAGAVIVRKPFSPAILLDAIRRALA